MTVHKSAGVAIFAAIAFSACGGGGNPPSGGGGGGGTPTAPPIVTRSYTFPAGDATASSGATAWDITGVTTTLSGQFGNANGDSYDTLRVDVTFAQNVANALPAAGAQLASPNQLGVIIALDTDANSATGTIAGCSSPNVKSFEYDTDQGNDPSRLADGNYSIIQNDVPISSGGENPPSEAMVSVSGNVLSETFFLTAVDVHGGKVAPKIGVGVASFNGTFMNGVGGEATDCIPVAPTAEVYTL